MADIPADKILIGCEEWCRFPDLGIPAIKARVDSGAKTSSLHAFNIKYSRRDGKARVSFDVHPIQKDRHTSVRCECTVIDRRMVKSSSGHTEPRYVVRSLLEMADRSWEIELTLTDRDSMGYRMLLGREAMSGHMIIDPSQRCALGTVSRTELDASYGRKPVRTRKPARTRKLASRR